MAKKLLKFRRANCLLISGLVFMLIFGIRLFGKLEFLELAAYDRLIRLQPGVSEVDSQADSSIVLITINEEDIRKLGRWPVSDAELAKALAILNRFSPRAIGLDIYRDIPVPPGSEELNLIFSQESNIVTAIKFSEKGKIAVHPPRAIKNAEQAGFTDIVIDPGGIVRRGLLFLDNGKKVYYSLALRLALLYLQAEGLTPQPDKLNPEHIRIGRTTIRPMRAGEGGYADLDSGGYQFLIDWKGFQQKFLSYSLTQLLSDKIDPERIKAKIIIIGVTAESVKDQFFTPFSRGLRGDQQISGITLHAQIVSQLLRFALQGDKPISGLGGWSEGMWMFLWSLLGGMASLRISSFRGFILFAGSGLAILGLGVYILFLNGWWIPFVPPALAYLISAAMVTAYLANVEKRDRSLIMHLFSRYVSPEVARAIWEKKDHFLDGGRPRSQKLYASVLFTDLVGFTSISEKMDHVVLMDWLNEYMESMARQVLQHGGVINKYLGDGMLVIFGVPVARSNEVEIGSDAVDAVSCAMAMGQELIRLNQDWKNRDLPTVGMRIGIFTGPLVAGSLGSAQRLEYTVIGDTVNTAARLESFEKQHFGANISKDPCRILIGESTLKYIAESFNTIRVGRVDLKGKDRRITVYRVLEGEKHKAKG